MRFTSQRSTTPSAQGFTLVEMLIVVGIMMIVAASSLLLLDRNDDQARFSKTKDAYKDLRTALFGPDMNTTMSGNMVISGYLADTGKLPNSIDDLLIKPAGMADWRPVAGAGTHAMGGRLYHGWRGPYINTTEGLTSDPWGNRWHYRILETATEAALRYRPGYTTLDPAPKPPSLELGSLGRDGAIGGLETFAKDFPETSLTIPSEMFTLIQVPIPARKLELYEGRQDVRTFHVGVIYPGLSIAEPFGGNPSDGYKTAHYSLLRKPGDTVPITIKMGGEVTNPGNDKKGTGGTTTPTGLKAQLPNDIVFNLGYARQFQLALYEAAKPGTALGQKLASIDPVIFSFMPKVNSTGGEVTSSNQDSNIWYIK